VQVPQLAARCLFLTAHSWEFPRNAICSNHETNMLGVRREGRILQRLAGRSRWSMRGVIAQRFLPDIALLDIGLPKMDGYSLARRLRSLGAIPHRALLRIGV
jgi:CheY-like chemotaxis protein